MAQLISVLNGMAMVCLYPKTYKPSLIPNEEMEMFKVVVLIGDNGGHWSLSDDKSSKERYCATDDMLKGSESSLVRIKNVWLSKSATSKPWQHPTSRKVICKRCDYLEPILLIINHLD